MEGQSFECARPSSMPPSSTGCLDSGSPSFALPFPARSRQRHLLQILPVPSITTAETAGSSQQGAACAEPAAASWATGTPGAQRWVNLDRQAWHLVEEGQEAEAARPGAATQTQAALMAAGKEGHGHGAGQGADPEPAKAAAVAAAAEAGPSGAGAPKAGVRKGRGLLSLLRDVFGSEIDQSISVGGNSCGQAGPTSGKGASVTQQQSPGQAIQAAQEAQDDGQQPEGPSIADAARAAAQAPAQAPADCTTTAPAAQAPATAASVQAPAQMLIALVAPEGQEHKGRKQEVEQALLQLCGPKGPGGGSVARYAGSRPVP